MGDDLGHGKSERDGLCGELIAQATKSAKQSAATGASAQKGKEEKKPKDEAKAKEPLLYDGRS